MLPSEKARAYSLKLEAMKRQAGRPSKENGGQVGLHFIRGKSKDILAEQVGESATQIQRYVNLTKLIPPLLEQVDNGILKVTPAADYNGISTLEQLMERQAQIEQEIQQRTELRQPLYAKRRCETDENIKEELVREIDRQTASLRQLRKERALCKRIEQQVPGIQQNLREFEENKSQNQKEAVRHEYQRRNR